MDLSSISTEELLRMRGSPPPSADLSSIPTEQLLKMRGAKDVRFHDLTDPTGTVGQNIAAGAGKAVADMGRGAGQAARAVLPTSFSDFIGLPTQQDIDEAARRDAPLMATKAGTAGNIAGDIGAYTVGTILTGGANVAGQAALGGLMGAARPVTTAEENANQSELSPRLKNTLVGAGTAAALTQVGNVAGEALVRRAAAKGVAGAEAAAQNAVRDQALADGRKAGYVIPPSSVNPTFSNQGVESLGGKIATEQTASTVNQKVTDRLAREAIGVPQTAALTEKSLQTIREDAGKAYQAIKDIKGVKFKPDAEFHQVTAAIGADFSQAAKEFPATTKNSGIEALTADLSGGPFSPKGIIEKVKDLRFKASSNFKAFDDPEKLALARAQRQAADALDGLLERNLAAGGQQAMADAYKSARTTIAKVHDVEAALTADGHVNAKVLGNMDGLSGELKTIGDFAGSFPKAVKAPANVGSPQVTTLRTAAGGVLGTVLGGPVGGAVGTAAGFAGPWTVRQMMLSKAGQSLMATPQYGTGAGTRTLAELLDSAALPAAGTAMVNRR